MVGMLGLNVIRKHGAITVVVNGGTSAPPDDWPSAASPRAEGATNRDPDLELPRLVLLDAHGLRFIIQAAKRVGELGGMFTARDTADAIRCLVKPNGAAAVTKSADPAGPAVRHEVRLSTVRPKGVARTRGTRRPRRVGAGPRRTARRSGGLPGR